MDKQELQEILETHSDWLNDGEGERADLRGADLRSADLWGADLRGANLSGAKGLLSQSKWMADNFEDNGEGYIVYKGITNTAFKVPGYWNIKEGEYLEEVCNPSRACDCTCGVNFATREWIQENYPKSTIWKCLIEYQDLPGVVVPYSANGKARCERLILVSKED